MRALSRVLFVVSIASAPACVEHLSPSGNGVRLGKADPLAGCRELGIVYGSGDGGGWTSSEDKLRSAENELRNKAAELGGNYVSMDVGSGDGRSTTISGRAFQCDEVPSPYAPLHQRPRAESSSAPAPSAPTVEERLAKIKDLLDRGIITKDEYDGRRAEILKAL